MTIPSTPVHVGPIDGPMVWSGQALEPSLWTWYWTPEAIEEIAEQVSRLAERGETLDSLVPGTFRLPSFAGQAALLRRELTSGRGFVLLKGLPVHRWSEQEASMVYWGLGSLIGQPLPQNVRLERLYAVRDEGYRIDRDYGRVGVRFSKTAEGLYFHTDSAPMLLGNTPDVIGLMALQVAAAGGESTLVNANAVHNAMLAERPDLLERLYQPYHFDRSMEWRDGESRTLLAPVFRFDERLEVRYFRFYIPKGHEIAGAPLAGEDISALDYFDAVMSRPELQVRFAMERGDILLMSNTYVLHARTAFRDGAEPGSRRHLKRLWLKVPQTNFV